MPKRIGYLYERLCDRDLIRTAIIVGSRGKRKRRDVIRVLKDADSYTEQMYRLVSQGKFSPTPPKPKKIIDLSSRKERTISIVPFYPDGIMHQMLVSVMKDVLMRGMYPYTCASIPGRGGKYAADYVKRALKHPKNTKYCLKLDIKKYYPSISVSCLMNELRRKIKDERFLSVVESVVSQSADGGLAIGYYINQWLANFYLEPLDHYIVSLPGVRYYVRYMDDMVILGPNKRKLHRARKEIEKFAQDRLRLHIKGNWQVFPVSARGIDFVGYRFYHTHTILRRRNFLKFVRQCRKIHKSNENGKALRFREAAGFISRFGALKHCDSCIMRKKYASGIEIKKLKNVVREMSKTCIPSVLYGGGDFNRGDIGCWDGEIYESTMDDNIWPPDDVPGGWIRTEVET